MNQWTPALDKIIELTHELCHFDRASVPSELVRPRLNQIRYQLDYLWQKRREELATKKDNGWIIKHNERLKNDKLIQQGKNRRYTR